MNFDLNRPNLARRFYRVGKTVGYHIVVVDVVGVVAAAVAAAIAAEAVTVAVVVDEALALRQSHRRHELVGRSTRGNVNATKSHFFRTVKKSRTTTRTRTTNFWFRVRIFSPPETFFETWKLSSTLFR